MMAANIAPGMNRSFTAETWKNLLAPELWKDAREEARDLVQKDTEVDIQGYDIDGEAIRAARQNAKDAGVDHMIHFQERPVQELSHPKKYGFIITNPPMGNGWKKRKTCRLSTVPLASGSGSWIPGPPTLSPDMRTQSGILAAGRTGTGKSITEC